MSVCEWWRQKSTSYRIVIVIDVVFLLAVAAVVIRIGLKPWGSTASSDSSSGTAGSNVYRGELALSLTKYGNSGEVIIVLLAISKAFLLVTDNN